MSAEQSLINRGIGDVITQSFGATENTFPGFSSGDFSSLLNLRFAFKDALAHRVTVLASSGDDGATDAESDGATLYPMRVNSWPSSDPLVTSVRRLDAQPRQQRQPTLTRRRMERRLRGRRRRPVRRLLASDLPDRRQPGRRQEPRHAGHLDERRGQRRRLDLHVLRRSQRRLAHHRRDQRGVADLLRHRRARRPGGPPPAGPDQSRALPAGRPRPARRPQDRDRGRHLR